MHPNMQYSEYENEDRMRCGILLAIMQNRTAESANQYTQPRRRSIFIILFFLRTREGGWV